MNMGSFQGNALAFGLRLKQEDGTVKQDYAIDASSLWFNGLQTKSADSKSQISNELNPSDDVSISQEAKDKAAAEGLNGSNENDAADGVAQGEAAAEGAGKHEDEGSGNSAVDSLRRQIREVQQKIREAQEKLNQAMSVAASAEDPADQAAAQTEVEAAQLEIQNLNAQLVTLNEQLQKAMKNSGDSGDFKATAGLWSPKPSNTTVRVIA